MKIDPHKIQLSEKDIEDYLYENPKSITGYGGSLIVQEWAARQFKVPSGIIDLLGVSEFGEAVIVEIKNVPFESKHLTQLARYGKDIERVMSGDYPPSYLVLIGPEGNFSNQLQFEADALGIKLFTFGLEFTVNVDGPWRFNQKYRDELRKEYAEIRKSDEIALILGTAHAMNDIRETKEGPEEDANE